MPTERAIALRQMGEAARKRHDLPVAQAHYEAAVALMRHGDDPLRFAHTIRHLGDVHAEQKHWHEADPCYAEALAIYREHPQPNLLDVANAIRAYAVLKTETGPREEARALWTEAHALYQAEGIPAGVEESRNQLEQLSHLPKTAPRF